MLTDFTTKPFRLSRKDHVDFAVRSYYRSVFAFPLILFYAGMVFGLPAVIFLRSLQHGHYTGFLIALLLMAVLWLVVIPGFCFVRIWRQFAKLPAAGSVHTMRMTPSALFIEGPSLDSKLSWAMFQKAEETRHALALYISRGMAHLVPKTAFSNEAEASEFLRAARLYVIHAKRNMAGNAESLPPVQEEAPDLPPGRQSQPYAYNFPFHARLYLCLTYRAFAKPAIPIIIVLAAGAVTGWLDYDDIRYSDWDAALPHFFSLLAVYTVTFALLPLALLAVSWSGVTKMAASRGLRTASLTSETLICQGQHFDSKIRWADLVKVGRGWGQMLFYTRPAMAIAVPYSAFADKAAADAFYQAALGYFRAARAGAAKTQLDGKG